MLNSRFTDSCAFMKMCPQSALTDITKMAGKMKTGEKRMMASTLTNMNRVTSTRSSVLLAIRLSTAESCQPDTFNADWN